MRTSGQRSSLTRGGSFDNATEVGGPGLKVEEGTTRLGANGRSNEIAVLAFLQYRKR
jgi:hypothetical protein